MATKPKGKVTAKKSVVAEAVVQKKPIRKAAPRKKRLAPRRTAAVGHSRVASTIAAKAPNPAALYPAPQYTRWTLIMLGEFYLLSILFALVVLGILYWATAMTNIWSIAHRMTGM